MDGHDAHRIVRTIDDLRQRRGEGTADWADSDLAGTASARASCGPLVVVAGAEGIEGGLRREPDRATARGRRPRRRWCRGSVRPCPGSGDGRRGHARTSMPRRSNHASSAVEPALAGRAPGRAVVAQDGARAARSGERPASTGPGRCAAARRHRPPAARAKREWSSSSVKGWTRAVRRGAMPHEVELPQLIRRRVLEAQRSRGGGGSAASRPWRRRMAVIVLGAGAAPRPGAPGHGAACAHPRPGAVARRASTAASTSGGVRRGEVCGRRDAIGQAGSSRRRPCQPLVAGLATDPEVPAQRGDVDPLLARQR